MRVRILRRFRGWSVGDELNLQPAAAAVWIAQGVAAPVTASDQETATLSASETAAMPAPRARKR